MTVQEVFDRFRKIIKDDIPEYRLADAELFDWIDDAIRETRIRRPDYLVDTDGTFLSVADITAVTDTINLPEHFKEALACHMAYSSYISEDADRHNTSQANAMLGRFEQLINVV